MDNKHLLHARWYHSFLYSVLLVDGVTGQNAKTWWLLGHRRRDLVLDSIT
jgi:hypothetical protein